MAQTNQNDTFYANNVRVLEFTLTDEAGNPLDLTGCTLRWAMSPLLIDGSYDTTAVLKKDSDTGGIVISDTTGGKARVIIDDADTVNLAGRFYHELEALDVAEDPVVVATGYLTILANVGND